jgi:tRNA dimethylallyltransferase
MKKLKLIVILGPTASGKTELAIKLAKKFNGEIISADSRQVYKGMDIGTDKVARDRPNKKRIFDKNSISFDSDSSEYLHRGIPHYLLDVASPKRRFTVVQYRKLALNAINKIQKKGKIPILCGGTGFYIQAVVDGLVIPEVPPNWKLRKKLEKKSAKELYKILKKLDPRRAKTIERKNPRRLIRAIEICLKIGKVPPLKFKPLPYPVLMIGIKRPKKELKQRIKKRFFKWLKKGLILEVIKLRKMGVSFKRIEEFGMHYREIARYLKGKISEKEMIENSIREIQNYAKRQLTWFKRDKRIKWLRVYSQAEKLVKNFLK